MKICPVCEKKFDDTVSFCPHDSQVLKDDHQSLVGKILDGQYEIEAFIAEGGMGTVYRARHTLLGDKVAIKFLPPEMRRSPEWLRRFQREGQAARRFRHPNAVAVHDLRTSSEGDIYLVMEYVAGRTLTNIIGEFGGKLAPFASIGIIEQVANVLDVAHEAGVVHRDLKPSNIMLTDEGGTVKLLDLGVAKITDTMGDSTLTNAGQFLGTPPYISPEQWGEVPRDRNPDIDGRTDVYSLGVIAYQLTAGVLPFKGASVLAYRRAHCKQPIPELGVAGVPSGWAQAVTHALAKDRADRFATAGEFARALRQAIDEAGLPSLDAYKTAPLTLPAVTAKLFADVTRRLPDIAGATQKALPETEASTQIMGEKPEVATQSALLEAATIANSQAPEPPAPKKADQMQGPPAQAAAAVTPQPLQVAAVAPQPLQVAAAAVSSRQPRRRPALIVGAAFLLLLPLVALGVLLMRRDSGPATKTQIVQVAVATPTPTPTPAKEPFMRYHLLVGTDAVTTGAHQTEEEAVAAAQYLQFVFWASESGHLYLLGTDKQEKLKAYPISATSAGLLLTARQNTTAPFTSKIKLESAGETSITVIFSPQPLDLPFAKEPPDLTGNPRKLTLDEQSKLAALRQEAVSPNISFSGEKGTKEAVVNFEGDGKGKSMIFDVKLQVK